MLNDGVEDREKQDAGERAPDAAPAASEQCSPDDYDGDRFQIIDAVASRPMARRTVGGSRDRGRSRRPTGCTARARRWSRDRCGCPQAARPPHCRRRRRDARQILSLSAGSTRGSRAERDRAPNRAGRRARHRRRAWNSTGTEPAKLVKLADSRPCRIRPDAERRDKRIDLQARDEQRR